MTANTPDTDAPADRQSPGNIYRFYRNKQAIGVAVVAGYFEMIEAAMDTELMLPEGTAEERIRRFLVTGIGHLVREIEQIPKIVEMADFMCENEDGRAVLNAHIDWKRRLIAREIEKGIATGELSPCEPERTAATVLGALKVFFIPMTLMHWRDRSTILPELNDILDLLFCGLRAR